MRVAISNVVANRQAGAFNIVLEQLGLTAFWDLVRSTNPSAKAPYHNNDHMFHVARVAYELYSLDTVVSGNFSRYAAKNLVVAGLVHDYDHSMGVTDDHSNIMRVFVALSRWRAEFPTMVNWDIVGGLVAATEFPYVDVGQYPLTNEYLRDADLMYGFEPHALEAVMLGISDEATHRLGYTMQPAEFLVAQRKFLDGVTPTTRAGIKVWCSAVSEAYTMQSEFAEDIAEFMRIEPPLPCTTKITATTPIDVTVESEEENLWRIVIRECDGTNVYLKEHDDYDRVWVSEKAYLTVPTSELAAQVCNLMRCMSTDSAVANQLTIEQFPFTTGVESHTWTLEIVNGLHQFTHYATKD